MITYDQISKDIFADDLIMPQQSLYPCDVLNIHICIAIVNCKNQQLNNVITITQLFVKLMKYFTVTVNNIIRRTPK